MSYNFCSRIPGFFRIVRFDAFQQLFMQVLCYFEIVGILVAIQEPALYLYREGFVQIGQYFVFGGYGNSRVKPDVGIDAFFQQVIGSGFFAGGQPVPDLLQVFFGTVNGCFFSDLYFYQLPHFFKVLKIGPFQTLR